MEYKLRVTPEVLNSVSGDVLNQVNKAEKTFLELDSLISGMSKHWQGSGYNGMREAYRIRKDDYERIFKAIKTHTNNLRIIAGGYTETENRNVDNIELYLPADIIE